MHCGTMYRHVLGFGPICPNVWMRHKSLGNFLRIAPSVDPQTTNAYLSGARSLTYSNVTNLLGSSHNYTRESFHQQCFSVQCGNQELPEEIWPMTKIEYSTISDSDITSGSGASTARAIFMVSFDTNRSSRKSCVALPTLPSNDGMQRLTVSLCERLKVSTLSMAFKSPLNWNFKLSEFWRYNDSLLFYKIYSLILNWVRHILEIIYWKLELFH